ncbi:hypothetical protein HID58_050806 [Brassica napus]|uniref:Uncharacterized protein n=2 Tax=Brassica napus TaxID=3708 RepID=A0ABQ8A755_BRANA|nr:hypothetical protein HID58_050806 [Brassica napus]
MKSDDETAKPASTEEETRLLRRRGVRRVIQAWKNKVFFEEDPFRSIFPLRDLQEPWTTMTSREYFADIASLCVKKLNEEKGTTVESVSIVRGNLKVGGGWNLYITFIAREYPNATMKSDDETAKLASTEEETSVEDEYDTSMEEESDSDNEGLWSVDEEEDDVERSPTINYSNMIEPEPEWDKDSYDGYECVFDPDGREGFPNDEAYEDFREYKIQAWKNRGFLEDPFRSVYPILDLEDLWSDRVNATRRQYLTNIASLCVKKLNEEKGSSVEVVSIARSNLKPGGGYKLYITFMAREVCSMKMSSDDPTSIECRDRRGYDEGVVRPPRNNFFNMQDPEPEWDKDSFDGYECYDPEDRESFSNDEEYEEFREFKFQAWKNKGFYEEGPFRYIFPLTDLEQRFRNMTTREYLADIASLCVKKLNEEKDERVCNLLRSVEFVSIVRGNLKAGDGWKLYITFTAREYLDGPLVEYQAKAMDFAGGETPPFPIICRPAPSMATSGLFHSTATMKGDDVSVKRASTEVESDASVSKKPKIEDEDDTSMEEESDSDNEGLWSVDAEDDDDGVRSPTINYSNLQDPEPEWDKDSYDGYELEFDPDGREGFSSDKAYAEFRDYKTKAFENRGFLEDPFRSIYPIRDLDDLWTTTTKRQYLTDIASLCVKKLNEEKGMSVEVISIVRGNLKPGGGWKLYITFMAREYPDGPLVEYQAKAGSLDSPATMLSDDSRAKRAATEEESDSSVSKKPKFEDEDDDDTSMEEESDSDSGRAWSVEAKDNDEEVVKPPNYLNMQDPEPEWDKDSYDGYELVFDSDGREGFSNDEDYKEFRDYKTKAWKNRGFLEDPFRSVYPILDLDDLWSDRVNVSRRQYLANIASLCVKKLNEEKRLSVEVVSIVRANLKARGGFKLYITFMAREHQDGPLVEYQAKAMDFAGGIKPPFPILCRPASSMP